MIFMKLFTFMHSFFGMFMILTQFAKVIVSIYNTSKVPNISKQSISLY